MKRLISLLALVFLIIFVLREGGFHFDREYVDIKQKYHSDQGNWSLFYDQSYVYQGASLRYQDDFQRMRPLIRPDSLLLSDLATSYHAAAVLPVYVLNVHRHHGRSKRRNWKDFIDSRYFCYLEFEENRQKVGAQLEKYPDLEYVIVNRDRNNVHRKKSCLTLRSDVLTLELPKIASLELSGEFLDLYRLKR